MIFFFEIENKISPEPAARQTLMMMLHLYYKSMESSAYKSPVRKYKVW